MQRSASGLTELQSAPEYQQLTAVQQGSVFALLPNTFYFVNHDAVLVNAWYVGKTVFDLLNADLQGLALTKLKL